MTNFDVCVCFVNGTKNGAHSLSMSISDNGDRLYSYGTVIAQKLQNGAIVLNGTNTRPKQEGTVLNLGNKRIG